MAPKRAKKVMGVATNFVENNDTATQPQGLDGKSRLPLSAANRIVNNDAMESVEEMDAFGNENEENCSSDYPQTKPNRNSNVWQHMKKCDDDKAECIYCEAMLSRKNGGTTGLRKHLHQIHKLQQFSPSLVKRRSNVKKVSIDTKKKIDSLIIKCIIEDGRSFGDFKRTGLLNIFKQLVPGKDSTCREWIFMFASSQVTCLHTDILFNDN